MNAVSTQPTNAPSPEGIGGPPISIRPQPGPQESFLSTIADIAFYGGAAGSGKTFAELLEPLRHMGNGKFGAVIFRRTHPEIKNEGALWDEAQDLYIPLGATQKESNLSFTFPSGMVVRFAHMQHEKDRHSWQGSQIPLIEFDELTHFTWKQFTYLLSRNRSSSGVRGYIRGTCNPDPDSWVRHFIDWWIEDETGLAIPERSGIVRYFTIVADNVEWANGWESLVKTFTCECSVKHLRAYMDKKTIHYPSKCPECDTQVKLPKSFTFITASVFDNQILLDQDPGYLSNLEALPLVDRERLLNGNWNIREAAGLIFQRGWFPIMETAPAGAEYVRYWDRAATEYDGSNDPSYTAGVKLGKTPDGRYFIAHVARFRGTPHMVKSQILNYAEQDGKDCTIGIEQDPGQAGKVEAQMLVRELAGYNARINVVRESKGIRARPVSAQAEQGNVSLVRGKWNEPFLREAENFDGTDKGHADQIDGLSGAFTFLALRRRAGTWGRKR